MSEPTQRSATVLVGMSVREVDIRDDLVALAAAAGPLSGVAFLQLGDPSLSRELDRLADAGVPRVVLVGVSLGSLAPAASWLRRIAAHWWRERAGHRPVVDVTTRLLTSLELASLAAVVAEVRPLTGAEAGLTSSAWDAVTTHRHQVLVCRGPRCTALGSDATAEALVLALVERDLGDDDVLVTHTGCQLPCNHAPLLSVQPDDVWYARVDPAAVTRIVDEHLVAGTPVEDLRLPR